MSVYEYIAFGSIFIFIFGYMISIFTKICSIENFIKTQPKFVYEVEIDNSQSHRKIISAGLPFSDYHKAKNINENMRNPIDYPQTGDNGFVTAIGIGTLSPTTGINNVKLGKSELKHNQQKKKKEINSNPYSLGIVGYINDKLQKEIKKNGVFKEKKSLMDFIFENSKKVPLNVKEIASIFIYLKENKLIRNTKSYESFDFNLDNKKYMKMIYNYCHWYFKNSLKIEKIDISTWKYKG